MSFPFPTRSATVARVRLLASVSVAAAGAVLFLACSGTTVGGGGSVGPVPVEDYCSRAADAFCPTITSCCNAAGYTVDPAACRSYALATCQSSVDQARAAGRVYDPNAAGECIGSVGVIYDGCYQRPSSDPAVKAANAVCERVWVGSSPLGGKCGSPSDCAAQPGGVDCRAPAGADSGTCTARAKVGDACGSSGSGGGYVNCADGAYCRYESGSSPIRSVCTARAGSGGACDTLSAQSCQEGLACDPTSKTCTAPPAVGQKCAGYGASACAAPAFCAPETTTCTAPRGAGAACQPFTSPSQCSAGLACESASKTCVALKPDGATCATGAECKNGRCSGAKCTRPTLADSSVCAVFGGRDAGPPPLPGGDGGL